MPIKSSKQTITRGGQPSAPAPTPTSSTATVSGGSSAGAATSNYRLPEVWIPRLYRLWRAAGSEMEALPQLQMEGQFTGECRWCEFRKGVCEVGRRPGVARAALEFAPWNPLEG